MVISSQLNELLELRDLLSQRLQCAVQLWFCDGTWQNFDNIAELDTTSTWPLLLANRITEQQLLTDFTLPNGQQGIIVPITLQRNVRSAYTIELPTTFTKYARTIIELTIQQFFQEQELTTTRSQINAYTYQVTSDFEELTWLRDICSHLEICDLNNPLQTVAQQILPTLRDLIHAEALAFITPTADPLIYGELPISLAQCQQLIQAKQELARHRPLVRNSTHRSECLPEAAGLHNYILIPVAKSNYQFGWLLALNKSTRLEEFQEEFEIASGLNAWEYGTFEAGLLSIAAVLMGTHACNVNFYQEQSNLLVGVIRTMINAIDAKDSYTCGHSDRVAAYGKMIADSLGYSPQECEQLYMAGLLHDIGKIGVPDSILGKPGKLTDEEFAIIKKHPEIGYSILRHLKPLTHVLPGVLHHHEAVDGTGYPHGLQGDAIPWQGRVLAVADAYDAMTSDRPYRKGMPSEKAENILREGRGKMWDAAMVDAFLLIIDQVEESKLYEQSRRDSLLQGADPRDAWQKFDLVQQAVSGLKDKEFAVR
jgi:HD-GYP domain-containing protein (c-di-GMP phosphodiesterase class II)